METLPLFLDVNGKRCLLVGDGENSDRKRRLLERAGAIVDASGDSFSEEQLSDVVLVVAASSDNLLNIRVSQAAKQRNIPVNVVDRPEQCTFIFPSIVERGPITIAVSSGGSVPVLTRLLRARIESLLPDSLGEFARQVAVFRRVVSARLPDMQQRLRFWDGLLQRQIIGADSNLEFTSYQSEFEKTLENFVAGKASSLVSIVGAGPGDVDLLTFKALRVMQACDVLIFDEGVGSEIVGLARRDARQLKVNSRDNVASILLEHARQSAHIVYLKMGDPLSHRNLPLVLAQLQAAGVVFDVVPGIIDQAGAEFYAV